MYQPVSNIPGVVDWTWIGIRKASQGVWHDQLANSSLPYCSYGGTGREIKLFSNSPIDWQDMRVNDLIHIALVYK